MREETIQDYGKDPISVRKTNKYQSEYVQSFVDKWDELIDWERRAQSEGRFFMDILRERRARRVVRGKTGRRLARVVGRGEGDVTEKRFCARR